MHLMNKFGFPRGKPKQAKVVKGFQTGDIVKAVVMEGVNTGIHTGRVAVRTTGSFNITVKCGKTVQGINHRYCTTLHKNDGYNYGHGKALPCKKGAPVSSLCVQAQGFPQAEIR